MHKFFAFTASSYDKPTSNPITFIIQADSSSDAINNFIRIYPRYTYSKYIELSELSQEMIEGALDDDLDGMYESYNCLAMGEEIPASEIIKKFYPDKYYKSLIPGYCHRNNIITEQYSDGSFRYFEIPND